MNKLANRYKKRNFQGQNLMIAFFQIVFLFLFYFYIQIQMSAYTQLLGSPHSHSYTQSPSTSLDSNHKQEHLDKNEQQKSLRFPSDIIVSQECISPTISLTNGFSRIPCEKQVEQKLMIYGEVEEIEMERDELLKVEEQKKLQKEEQNNQKSKDKIKVGDILQSQVENEHLYRTEGLLFPQNLLKLIQLRQKASTHLSNLKSNLKQLQSKKQLAVRRLQNHTNRLLTDWIAPSAQIIFNQFLSNFHLKQDLSQQNSLYHSLKNQLTECPPPKLLGEFGEQLANSISKIIQDVSQKNIDKCNIKLIDVIRPEPLIYEFEVNNFDEKRSNKEEIFSDCFGGCQSKWILKIYPSGFIGPNSPAKMKEVQYLSIYVQMVDSVRSNTKFIVKVELIDEINQQNRISKQFRAEYVRGESWGYDRYIRVANLYRHGFVNFNNRLKIRIQINFEQYKDCIQVLSQKISQKQRREYQNDRKIRKMKALLKNKQIKEDKIKVQTKIQHKNLGIEQSVKKQVKEKEGPNIPSRSLKLGQISLEKLQHPKIIRLCSIKNSSLQKNKIYIRRFNVSAS